MLIGELLVQSGLINVHQLEMGLSRHFQTHDKLGECLVLLGFITESKMLQAVSNQLRLPYYDAIPDDFIRKDSSPIIPKRQAIEIGLVLAQKDGCNLVFFNDNFGAVQAFISGLGIDSSYAMSRSSQIRRAIESAYV